MKRKEIIVILSVFVLAAVCLLAPAPVHSAGPAFADYFLKPFKACVGDVPIEFVFTSASLIPNPFDSTKKVSIADVAGRGVFGGAKRPIGINGTAILDGSYVRFNLVVPSTVNQTAQVPAVWEFQVKNKDWTGVHSGIVGSGQWQLIGATSTTGKLSVGCK